jgi:hypothetical protein
MLALNFSVSYNMNLTSMILISDPHLIHKSHYQNFYYTSDVYHHVIFLPIKNKSLVSGICNRRQALHYLSFLFPLDVPENSDIYCTTLF